MSDIQRWDFIEDYRDKGVWRYTGPSKGDEGVWVTYADHVAAVAAALNDDQDKRIATRVTYLDGQEVGYAKGYDVGYVAGRDAGLTLAREAVVTANDERGYDTTIEWSGTDEYAEGWTDSISVALAAIDGITP
jgi:hypothetical protein